MIIYYGNEVRDMPLNGFKSVTVSSETYENARKLVNLGVDRNLGQVFANAIKEYVQEKEKMIRELEAVKAKYAKK